MSVTEFRYPAFSGIFNFTVRILVRTDSRRYDPDIKSYKVYERCRSYDLSSKAFGLEDVGKALEYSLKTVHAIQVGVSVEKFISQKVSLSH